MMKYDGEGGLLRRSAGGEVKNAFIGEKQGRRGLDGRWLIFPHFFLILLLTFLEFLERGRQAFKTGNGYQAGKEGID